MAVDPRYAADVDAILSHRHDGGADCWTTPDRRLLKGSPFSAYTSAQMLLELGVEPDAPILRDVATLFFDAWRDDGRFKLYPDGAIYHCHTAPAADLLCRMGYADDPRLHTTFDYLLDSGFVDGGWRCKKFSFGRGPETEHSNPLPTLTALSAFRHSSHLNREPTLDKAVEFLLSHWDTRLPIGPCHYGIGTLFMQVSYPLSEYNLFSYVHTLSFYDRAKEDRRFIEALAALEATLDDGMVVVQRVAPRLARLEFCKKGRPSELATRKYRQIVANLA